MQCTYCATENRCRSMDLSEALALLDHLAEQNVRNVVFGGGEPLTWAADITTLCAAAQRKGFFVQLGTNGILLPHFLPILQHCDRIVLPLDAAEALKHDTLRRFRESHFALMEDLLERLRREQKEITISTVVCRYNLPALPGLATYLQKYVERGGRLHAWHLYRFLPIGRGGRRSAKDLGISQREYHHVCNHVRKTITAFRVYKRPDMFQSRTVCFFWRERDGLHSLLPDHQRTPQEC